MPAARGPLNKRASTRGLLTTMHVSNCQLPLILFFFFCLPDSSVLLANMCKYQAVKAYKRLCIFLLQAAKRVDSLLLKIMVKDPLILQFWGLQTVRNNDFAP